MSMTLETKLKIADKFKERSKELSPSSKIYFTDEVIMATDRYKLVEIKRDKDNDDHVFYNESIVLNDPEMPDYKQVIPSGEPKLTIKFQVKYLKAMMDAFKLGKKQLITIDLYDYNQAVKITSDDGEITTIAMPVINK